MNLLYHLADLSNDLKLSGFSPLYQVFLSLGFGVFAVTKALAWVMNWVTDYQESIVELESLNTEVSNQMNFDLSDKEEEIVPIAEEGEFNHESELIPNLNFEEGKLLYRSLGELRMKVSNKKVNILDEEGMLISTGRMDFLQMGLFAFIMLLASGFENVILNPDYFHFFVYVIFSINLVSIALFRARDFSFYLKNHEYKELNTGLKHYAIIFRKALYVFFLTALFCIAIYVVMPRYVLTINVVFIIILSMLNLVYPFLLLYVRGKAFEKMIEEESIRSVFSLNIRRELDQIMNQTPLVPTHSQHF